MLREKKIMLSLKYLFFCLFLIFSFCPGLLTAGLPEEASLSVLTSILPLYEFSRAVAGNRAEVELLLPAGANPHHWQPRPSDMIKLQKADLLVCIGPSLEPWVDDLVRSRRNDKLRVLSLQHLCSLHEEEGRKELDPHIWLDFQLDQQIIEELVSAFSTLRPAYVEEFRHRANIYVSHLQELDELYQKVISSCAQRLLVVDGHGAFNYLAKRYGLTQISLHGLNPEAEPLPGQVSRVLALVESQKMKAIFYEYGTNPRLARVLAQKSGVKIIPLHPGHNLPVEERRSGKDFLRLMRENLEHLKEGLGCD